MGIQKIKIGDNDYCYFESKDVRVFPCSYRGYKEGDTNLIVFDPEARMNTEYNYINSASTGNIDSYILSWSEDGILKCVIHGYYFEITTGSDLTDIKPAYLNIALASITLGTSSADSDRQTEILTSQYSTPSDNGANTALDDMYLDKKYKKLDGTDTYIFSGLTIMEEASTAVNNYSLQILDATGKIPEESYLPKVIHGTGKNSIIIGENNEASGDNSFAAGYDVKAEKDNETVVGQYFNAASISKWTTPSKNPIFVVGNGKKITTNETTTIEYHPALVIGENSGHTQNDIAIYGKTFIDGNTTIRARDEKHTLILSSGSVSEPNTDGKLEAIVDEFNVKIGNISTKKDRVLVHNKKEVSASNDEESEKFDILLNGDTLLKANNNKD